MRFSPSLYLRVSVGPSAAAITWSTVTLVMVLFGMEFSGASSQGAAPSRFSALLLWWVYRQCPPEVGDGLLASPEPFK